MRGKGIFLGLFFLFALTLSLYGKGESRGLKVDEVLALKGMGYKNEEILQELKKTKSTFPHLTTAEIKSLRKGGVGEKVLQYILATGPKNVLTLAKVKSLSQRGMASYKIIQLIGKSGLKVKLNLAQSLALLREKLHPGVILALKKRPLKSEELLFLCTKNTSTKVYLALIDLLGIQGKFSSQEMVRLAQKGLPLSVIQRLEKLFNQEQKQVDPPAKWREISKDIQWFRKGKTLMARERWDGALTALSKAIKINPKFARAYGSRARVFCELGHRNLDKKAFARALLDANRALAFDPSLVDGYLNRARALAGQKKLSQALDDVNGALRRAPKSPEPLYVRAGIRILQRNYKKALVDLDRSIELQPTFGNGYASRGVIYGLFLNQPARGMDQLNQALKLNPFSGNIYFFRALLQMRQKNYSEAQADLNEVLARDPKHLMAYFYRGILHKKMRNFSKALRDFTLLIQLNPSWDQAYANRAVVYIYIKKYKKALADFSKALSLNPKMADAYHGRATLRFRMGDKQGALRDWKKFLELAPHHPNRSTVQKIIEKIQKEQKSKPRARKY